MDENGPERQRGSALIISLVFLLLTSLVAVSAVRNSTGQERMAGNLKLKNESFQAAETALRIAEDKLLAELPRYGTACSGNECELDERFFEVDLDDMPQLGWEVLQASSETNHMTVWYRIINLGASAALRTLNGSEEGTLYRIVVIASRGTTRTVLESFYVHDQG